MFIWMTDLLDVSRMWYTENQRKCFFEKVDALYIEYCVHFVREMVPHTKRQLIEQKIRDGINIEDWWDSKIFPECSIKQFEQEKVYPAMFDDLEKNGFYWKDIYINAPAENIEEWFNCSTVKSLLHEFVNDEENPFEIKDHLSDKEIACFSYTIYSIYVDYLKQHLNIDEENSDRLLKLLYCGEFAQNEWLNLVNGENIKEIRFGLTRRFLSRYLSNDFNMGIEPQFFSEFINEEVLAPIYRDIYYSRYEILKNGRKYLEQNADKKWTPSEMNNFYDFIKENVKLDFKAPNYNLYKPSQINDIGDDDDANMHIEMLEFDESDLDFLKEQFELKK